MANPATRVFSELCLLGSAVKCAQKRPERLGCPQILMLLSGERADPTGLINTFRVMKLTATL